MASTENSSVLEAQLKLRTLELQAEQEKQLRLEARKDKLAAMKDVKDKRLAKEAKEEKLRLAKEAKEEKLRLEKEAKEEKLRLEAREEKLRLEAREEKIRQEDREFQLAMVRAKKEIEAEPKMNRSQGVQLPLNFQHHLPRFSESNVDVFFANFEKVAETLTWPRQFWPVMIQREFIGKAQEVVAALAIEESNDYDTVKGVVLAAYELVPEAYRQTFRQLRRENGQNLTEFANRKEIAFNRWCKSVEVGENFKRLKEMILLEEFKNCVAPPVRIYLNERCPVTLLEASRMADEYEVSHRTNLGQQYQPRTYLGRGGNYIQCDHCGKPGHLESDCFHLKNQELKSSGDAQTNGGNQISCFLCKENGHIKRFCPLLQEGAQTQAYRALPVGLVGVSSRSVQGPATSCKKLVHETTDTVGLMTSQQVVETFGEHMCKGFVLAEDGSENEVTLMRDSGAAHSLIRKGILPQQLPGNSSHAIMKGFGGGSCLGVIRQISLKSYMVNGEVDVAELKEDDLLFPGVDVLIGQDLVRGGLQDLPGMTNTPSSDEAVKGLTENIPDRFQTKDREPPSSFVRCTSSVPKMTMEPVHMRKIFVGGLNYATTDQSLHSYFSGYGTIVDCVVMTDSVTRSRGFGFVTFDQSSVVEIVQSNRPHTIDGKPVETKRAVPKSKVNSCLESKTAVNKVFIGGFKDPVTEDDLRTYFGRFGDVKNVETFTNKNTGKKKGFAFISFDDYDVVDRCLMHINVENIDKKVEVNGVRMGVEKAKSLAEIKDSRGSGCGGFLWEAEVAT